jgi:hypothetical protein
MREVSRAADEGDADFAVSRTLLNCANRDYRTWVGVNAAPAVQEYAMDISA